VEILIYNLANFIADKGTAEDERGTNASCSGSELHEDSSRDKIPNCLKQSEMFRRRLEERIASHANKLIAFTLVEDVQASLGCSMTDGDCTYGGFALESVNQVLHNCLSMVVKNQASTEALDVFEVLR
jgi:hypothetical protein